jgi:hypothetical protein
VTSRSMYGKLERDGPGNARGVRGARRCRRGCV